MEVGTRRLLHHNVTAHPTAEWTLQQFRETLPGDHPYRFALHDRDSIFSRELDKAVTQLGVRVLRTPVQAPMANAFCERLGGSLRRECLDFLIPLNERHLRMIVKEWGIHYNRGRPHSSFRNPARRVCRPVTNGTSCPPDTASGRPRSLAAYITSITWSRRQLERRCQGADGIFADHRHRRSVGGDIVKRRIPVCHSGGAQGCSW